MRIKPSLLHPPIPVMPQSPHDTTWHAPQTCGPWEKTGRQKVKKNTTNVIDNQEKEFPIGKFFDVLENQVFTNAPLVWLIFPLTV